VTTARPELGGIGSRTSVVFFGSGPFAVPILDALEGAASNALEPPVAVTLIITTPDRPAGRGARPRATPVAARARELGLPLVQPTRLRDREVRERIAAVAPEVGVLADYGRIVPPELLDLPRHGILNVHPSLLPRHRGATPIRATITAGDPTAGVSIIRMDAGIDTGPIVAAEAWPLGGHERAGELEGEAARRGAALLARTLGPWLAGSVAATPQDETAATLTRTVRREDGRLDPGLPAIQLEREVRANDPWPGSFLETPLGRILVRRASVAPRMAGDEAGVVVAEVGRPAVATVDGRLVLDELQLEGRRALGGEEFLRGQPRLLGMRVEPGDGAPRR
jgi:methionyl-tRNA formyltransferase